MATPIKTIYTKEQVSKYLARGLGVGQSAVVLDLDGRLADASLAEMIPHPDCASHPWPSSSSNIPIPDALGAMSPMALDKVCPLAYHPIDINQVDITRHLDLRSGTQAAQPPSAPMPTSVPGKQIIPDMSVVDDHHAGIYLIGNLEKTVPQSRLGQSFGAPAVMTNDTTDVDFELEGEDELDEEDGHLTSDQDIRQAPVDQNKAGMDAGEGVDGSDGDSEPGEGIGEGNKDGVIASAALIREGRSLAEKCGKLWQATAKADREIRKDAARRLLDIGVPLCLSAGRSDLLDRNLLPLPSDDRGQNPKRGWAQVTARWCTSPAQLGTITGRPWHMPSPILDDIRLYAKDIDIIRNSAYTNEPKGFACGDDGGDRAFIAFLAYILRICALEALDTGVAPTIVSVANCLADPEQVQLLLPNLASHGEGKVLALQDVRRVILWGTLGAGTRERRVIIVMYEEAEDETEEEASAGGNGVAFDVYDTFMPEEVSLKNRKHMAETEADYLKDRLRRVAAQIAPGKSCSHANPMQGPLRVKDSNIANLLCIGVLDMLCRPLSVRKSVGAGSETGRDGSDGADDEDVSEDSPIQWDELSGLWGNVGARANRPSSTMVARAVHVAFMRWLIGEYARIMAFMLWCKDGADGL